MDYTDGVSNGGAVGTTTDISQYPFNNAGTTGTTEDYE